MYLHPIYRAQRTKELITKITETNVYRLIGLIYFSSHVTVVVPYRVDVEVFYDECETISHAIGRTPDNESCIC